MSGKRLTQPGLALNFDLLLLIISFLYRQFDSALKTTAFSIFRPSNIAV